MTPQINNEPQVVTNYSIPEIEFKEETIQIIEHQDQQREKPKAQVFNIYEDIFK